MDLKRRAINLMTPTDAGASEVLVIDKNVQSVDYTNYEDMQKERSLFLRLCFSPWMSRSWTFQEGALSRRLYVRTATIVEPLDHLTLPLGPRGGKQRLFTNVDRLSRRDTSQKNDIHLLLANLGLLDSHELHNLIPERRFQAHLRSQSPEFAFGLLSRNNLGRELVQADDWWVPMCEERIRLPVQDQ